MKFSKFKKTDYKVNNNQFSNVINKNLKTTNVNILLNRVRIEKKKTFKKKMFFLISLISILSLIGFVLLGN
tara:strand:- start:93 stop:305 length:213 start_codon:yes stop_codon:yes gene_type:complete